MFQTRWIFLAALVSAQAFGSVSFQEKKNRVAFLNELSQSSAISMNIEAYHRELNYEQENLPLDKRAENEAKLLSEKVRVQIAKVYEAALESHGDTGIAVEEVRTAIEKDLMLVSEELQDEMRNLSLNALEGIQRGEISSDYNLVNIEKALMKGVADRSNFLNEEGDNSLPPGMAKNDSSRTSYTNKADILESLTSNRESVEWVTTAGNTIKSADTRKVDSRVSLQVKVEFLGIGIEAGPSIYFKREYKTNVSVMSQGMTPSILPDGNFDFVERDRMGQAVKVNGKNKKRFISFQCDADLEFQTDYAGAGGFSFAGIGGSAGVTKSFANSVNIASRRLLLPEIIGNKAVSMKTLTELCHNEFLNARVTNNLTVTGALNAMMKNVIASLRFSHPKTKCSTDNHCAKWFNSDVTALAKKNNKARCVEESKEKYMKCELRGQNGQSCIVYDSKGKRLSSGSMEYNCDNGLRCVQTTEAGFMTAAKGQCMPIKK